MTKHADFIVEAVTKDGLRVTGFYYGDKPLTICRAPDRRDQQYYCIKQLEHDGRHRYGVTISGEWRWS